MIMSKTFKLMILFVALIAMNKVNAQDSSAQMIVFQGTADAKYNGEYVHIYNHMLNEKHDSVIVANGTFTFKQQFKEPTRYMFYSSFEIKAKHGYAPFGILVDHPSVIHFAADMESLVNSKITGSSAQDVYNLFNEQTEPAQKSMMDKLYAKYGRDFVESNKPDTSGQKYKSLMHDYEELNAANTVAEYKILEATIRKNPSSFASIVLLDRNIRDLSLAKREELYGLISPAYKKGYFADQIESNISGMKKSALGSTVENFTLNDPQGKPMNFSALKGKYVLIDFWGSWCGPCHIAFPALRSLYTKYHDKGFEILGIATETNPDAWVKDINKEKLPWLQMIDIKGSQSISQTQFAITQYPTTVLIGPDGKIIGRYGDNGKTEEDRDKQLAAIFKN
jgi:thiol-disulfide isomerase/thioredoxin